MCNHYIMQEYKYKQTFASTPVKCILGEDKDLFFAKASLDELRKSIPNIPTDNEAFLPISFNCCLANVVNKNDDVIDTETALRIYDKFISNPCNIEHHRSNVVGVIVTAGFSEYKTDKTLDYETVKNLKTPFYITLGAVIWRVVKPEFA